MDAESKERPDWAEQLSAEGFWEWWCQHVADPEDEKEWSLVASWAYDAWCAALKYTKEGGGDGR